MYGLPRIAGAAVVSLFVASVSNWMTLALFEPAIVPEPALAPGLSDLATVALNAELRCQRGGKQAKEIAVRLRTVANLLDQDPIPGAGGRDTFVLAYGLKALAEGNRGGAYDTAIQHIARKLKSSQQNESAGCERSDARFGGTGFCRHAYPDLFHTSLAIEALQSAGVPVDDPYMQRALVFVSRCQNLPGGQSPGPMSREERGGFCIVPVGLREGDSEEPSRHACGSLTCAGLGSLLRLGITRSDERVEVAIHWLSNNYSLCANPGIGAPRSRLYEYYLAFANTMNALDLETLSDARNRRHDWRKELTEILMAEQDVNGAWHNSEESDNHRESHPLVVTSYALLALDACSRRP